MNHRYTAAVVLGGLLILPVIGCVSIGKRVDASRVATIVDGQTTKAQVSKMFGKPAGYTTSANVEIWSWSYTGGNVLGGRSQNLTIAFDDKGVVKSHSFIDVK